MADLVVKLLDLLLRVLHFVHMAVMETFSMFCKCNKTGKSVFDCFEFRPGVFFVNLTTSFTYRCFDLHERQVRGRGAHKAIEQLLQCYINSLRPALVNQIKRIKQIVREVCTVGSCSPYSGYI